MFLKNFNLIMKSTAKANGKNLDGMIYSTFRTLAVLFIIKFVANIVMLFTKWPIFFKYISIH